MTPSDLLLWWVQARLLSAAWQTHQATYYRLWAAFCPERIQAAMGRLESRAKIVERAKRLERSKAQIAAWSGTLPYESLQAWLDGRRRK